MNYISAVWILGETVRPWPADSAYVIRIAICEPTYCIDVDIMLAVHVNANILTLEQHTGSYIMGLSKHVSCDQDSPVS